MRLSSSFSMSSAAFLMSSVFPQTPELTLWIIIIEPLGMTTFAPGTLVMIVAALMAAPSIRKVICPLCAFRSE
jgi:hypothetical protein